MRNKKLFQRTKASNQEFRILADEDLDYVSGGTDSLESEESSEETPEVQSDSSDSGSSEEKLEDLASQAVAAAEAPVESAPVDTTTVDSTPIETQTDSQVDNTVAETEGASLQGVNTVSSLGENGLAERLNETVNAYIQENYDAQSGSYMAERGDDSSSSVEALRAAKEQAIKDMIANRGTHLSIADLRSKASKAPQLAANYSNVGSIDNHGDYGQSYQENNTNYQPDNDANDSTASIDIGTQANQVVKVSIEDMREAALAAAALLQGETVSATDEAAARETLQAYTSALQSQLNQQASIGAIKNRLEFTSNNITLASENVASAEATYSDADMAKEMTQFINNNIMEQSATPMLAQANQMPQGILNLLQ